MNEKTLHTFQLSLQLQAPILTQKSGALAHGYDQAMWRYQGEPALPGSLIAGNLRHVLESFARLLAERENAVELNQQRIDQWFGKPSDHNHEPNTGQLNFDYAWQLDDDPAQPAEQNNNNRHRIEIDEETGTVATGSLVVIESPFQTGETPRFTGEIRAFCSPKESTKILQWLLKAACYLAAIGSLKSAGFGKIIDAKCTIKKEQAVETPKLDETTYRLQLSADRPLCIAPHRLPNTNRFETLDYIPGNILKGAIAHTLQSLGHSSLEEIDFDSWSISHSYICEKESKPALNKLARIIPQSVACYQNSEGPAFIDYAQFNQPQNNLPLLFPDNDSSAQKRYAPAFQTDWKDADRDAAKIKLDLLVEPDMQRTLSLHTRIKAQTNNAEKNGLFSQEEISPVDNEESVWACDINLNNVDPEKRTAAQQALQTLAKNGIHNLGRSKAQLSLNFLPRPTQHKVELPADLTPDHRLVITLLSDGSLFRRPDISVKATGDTLHHDYQNYWQTCFEALADNPDQRPQLETFFATQKRVGGQHYNIRYQAKRTNDDPGADWLTEAGSVFVFSLPATIDRAALAERLNTLIDEGLPPAHNHDWRTNPYIPEHGFGRIQLTLQPASQEAQS